MSRGVAGHSPSNVQKFLKGQNYPAQKNDLLNTAKKNKAPSEVMEVIQKLPGDEFGGPQEVMHAYGKEDGHKSKSRHANPSLKTGSRAGARRDDAESDRAENDDEDIDEDLEETDQ